MTTGAPVVYGYDEVEKVYRYPKGRSDRLTEEGNPFPYVLNGGPLYKIKFLEYHNWLEENLKDYHGYSPYDSDILVLDAQYIGPRERDYQRIPPGIHLRYRILEPDYVQFSRGYGEYTGQSGIQEGVMHPELRDIVNFGHIRLYEVTDSEIEDVEAEYFAECGYNSAGRNIVQATTHSQSSRLHLERYVDWREYTLSKNPTKPDPMPVPRNVEELSLLLRIDHLFHWECLVHQVTYDIMKMSPRPEYLTDVRDIFEKRLADPPSRVKGIVRRLIQDTGAAVIKATHNKATRDGSIAGGIDSGIISPFPADTPTDDTAPVDAPADTT